MILPGVQFDFSLDSPVEVHISNNNFLVWSLYTSVTRFGDLLDFGQLFKAFGNN